MHELGIAQSILDSVEREAPKHTQGRAVAVGVRLGEVSGVDPEALTFSFDALVRGTPLEGLRLDLEKVPHRRACPACSREFLAGEMHCMCPGCGGLDTRFLGGDELEICFLEVEEP